MAEIAVSFVINKLVPLLQEEAKLLGGVSREANSIIADLQVIQPFLRDADERDARGELDEGVKAWVKQVRQVSHKIEDVIDEYMLHLAKRPQQRGFIGFFNKVGHLIRKLKPRHDIASEIQDVKRTISELNERRNTYGFSSIDQQGSTSSGKNIPWHDPRVASLFIEEAEVVGIESPRKELISWLVEGSPKRGVISVVGMGGIGKTTLAKKVYDNPIVTAHFNCHAWISVSETYKMEELLKIMIKKLYKEQKGSTPEDIDKMDVTALIEKIRGYLEGKRYVVVFDDVWDSQFWGFIKNALTDKADKGSRVIITTRSEAVADSVKDSPFYHVHKLQPLPPEMAWDLFCKKAFEADFGGVCPPELTDLSQKILKRCEGLPLAIVTIGGVLSTKEKVTQQWQEFLDSLGSELGSNPLFTGIKRILSLSYFDLPYHLKLCYLYFGIFPEDFSMSRVRLIRLWIAEGLVQRKDCKTLEEVAEEYLTELIYRNLVQVSEVNVDGKARFCRVHDMMREIILLISKDFGFCDILSKDNPGFESLDRLEPRRLSIHNSEDKVLESITGSRIRSIFSFNANVLPESFVGILFLNLKLLKTLDFENAPLHYIPEEVGNLFHLRYLSLRDTKIKVLPKSIGKLQNLLTLDLKRSLVSELPVEINRLHKLRNLLVYYLLEKIEPGFEPRDGVRIHEGFGRLEAMQKLYYVKANHGPWLFEDLRKLTQLRKLGVQNLKIEDGKALCTAIEKMNHLESLDVESLSRDEILDLQHIACAPQNLRRLYLQGRLEKFPVWISKLANLVRVSFRWSKLTEDPLPFLQALPRLLDLKLSDAYDGELLHFREGGFQKLKFLDLEYLNALNLVIIDNGALPLLQELRIGPIPQLKEVPSGIQHLRKLTNLTFYDMTYEFELTMLLEEGQDYKVVEHIPTVLFAYRNESGGYDAYYLR
ncbi:disease resistance protein RPM1-like [Actinidia eriantha]|uniref:disease resistance protein RPM1-like n=1 Tax=Actinidia eriantha TaxID=165200 RepID=UPI00258364FA|nr:disease resistance protein RPM1-like [Actinidia eriantha]XP_057499612.1 disease resistance protein RPM1-like [Actinidia eriantha]